MNQPTWITFNETIHRHFCTNKTIKKKTIWLFLPDPDPKVYPDPDPGKIPDPTGSGLRTLITRLPGGLIGTWEGGPRQYATLPGPGLLLNILAAQYTRRTIFRRSVKNFGFSSYPWVWPKWKLKNPVFKSLNHSIRTIENTSDLGFYSTSGFLVNSHFQMTKKKEHGLGM